MSAKIIVVTLPDQT